MSTTNSLASVIQSLGQAKGAIKAKSTQIVSQGAGVQGAGTVFQLTGDSLANLQDQINNTRQNALGIANFIESTGLDLSPNQNTQILFNDNGSVGQSPNWTFNKTTNIVLLLGSFETNMVSVFTTLTGGYETQIEPNLITNTFNANNRFVLSGLTGASLSMWNGSNVIGAILDTRSGYATLALQNGTGTGGFDTLGATIYSNASTGKTQMELLAVGAPGAGGFDSLGATIYGSGATGLLETYALTVNNPGTSVADVAITPTGITLNNSSSHEVMLFDGSSGFGNVFIANGTGSGGWDGNGATIQLDGSSSNIAVYNASTTNSVIIGGSSITSLYQNTHGQTIWYLANSGSDGLFGISNGSGTGGFDSNGATIYGTGSNGTLQAYTLTASIPGGVFGTASASLAPEALEIANSSGTNVVTVGSATGGGLLSLLTSAPAIGFRLDVGNTYTATSASGGSQTLPASPAGFLIVTIAGSTQKIPYYNS